jgi:hypothetical protein
MWSRLFPLIFRTTPHRLMRALRRRTASPYEELIVVGRRSGRPRELLVTLATVDGRWYVGHPDGAPTAWVANLEAARGATIVRRDGSAVAVVATPLADGQERDAAIEAAIRIQRFPVSRIYRGARRHILAEGQYFRLEPTTSSA